MATLCIACGCRESVSVDEHGIPPLCDSCWSTRGDDGVRVGNRVICTQDVSCSGTIRTMDATDLIAVVRTSDGGDAWIPVAELVAVK